MDSSLIFRDKICLAGWPHNTFSSIKQNAQELYDKIVTKIGVDGPTIIFVCHSRGGLLVRQVAVLLQKYYPEIAAKICRCITFGTPHQGAALAEIPLDLVAALLVIGKKAKNHLSLFRVLAYYAQQHFFPGLEDLKRAPIGGEFLQELWDEERAMASSQGLRLMDIYSVGGDCSDKNNLQTEMLTRMLGTNKHDCVVELSSSLLLDNCEEKNQVVNCKLGNYFDSNMAYPGALKHIQECFFENKQFVSRQKNGVSSSGSGGILKTDEYIIVDGVKLPRRKRP